jgi:opacity protein-like surface antigen
MRTMLKQFVMTVLGAVLIGFCAMASAADTAVVIVSHEVANFSEWKKRFDAGKANREKAGLKERYVMRDVDKPNFVIVVLEGSLENAKKFVADPVFKDRVKKASATGTAEIKVGTTNTAGK